MEQIESIPPVQARLHLFGFLALAIGICVNALYFQESQSNAKSKRQISPNKIDLQSSDERRARYVSTTQSLPKDKSAGLSNKEVNVVGAIQRELSSLGYKPEKDGSAGLITRAAILAYEYDMGLRLTATPSDKVLQNLVFGVPARKSSHNAPVSKAGKQIIRVVQKVLTDISFDPGPINGKLTDKTRRAIRKFEKVRDLKVTGRVSGQLIRELIDYTQSPLGG